MTKTINTAKYTRYTKLNNARDLLNELEDSQYSERESFKKANEAIGFLKDHAEDNEFEREAATSAIIKAIAYLEEFEQHLKQAMIEGIAEDERKAKVSKDAHIKAQKILDEKIEPLLNEFLTGVESLGAITGYSYSWHAKDFEAIVSKVMTATRTTRNQSVFLTGQ